MQTTKPDFLHILIEQPDEGEPLFKAVTQVSSYKRRDDSRGFLLRFDDGDVLDVDDVRVQYVATNSARIRWRGSDVAEENARAWQAIKDAAAKAAKRAAAKRAAAKRAAAKKGASA